MSSKFSLVIITLNEANRLPRLLTAMAPLCDDIVVVDSGSTDDTCAVAQKFGARVSHHDFIGFGPQKSAAVALARHDWIVSLDADEVPDAQLISALRAWCSIPHPTTHAWALNRLNRIGGIPVRHGAWNPDHVVRIFHRTQAAFDDAAVHERVLTTGPITVLPGILEHDTYADYRGLFSTRYHLFKARRLRAADKSCNALVLVLRAMWGFFRSYVFKAGFLDGRAGVMLALAEAVNATLGYALASESAWPLDEQPSSQMSAKISA